MCGASREIREARPFSFEQSATVERARTLLDQQLPYQGPPTVVGGIGEKAQTFQALQRIANLVIAASMVIADCSLAVSVVAGIAERKRPFTLLRLAGVRVTTLRRVVALETGVPLVIVSLLSVGLGLVATEPVFTPTRALLLLCGSGRPYFVTCNCRCNLANYRAGYETR